MKITQVNTYFVRPRWGFVEILTDEGITGWGEAVLEGHAKAVLACVEEYRDYLIGKDPSRIEDIWSTIFRAGFYRGGTHQILSVKRCLMEDKALGQIADIAVSLLAEMNALETLEAKIYKALDKTEALIQHNESDISTWLPLVLL